MSFAGRGTFVVLPAESPILQDSMPWRALGSGVPACPWTVPLEVGGIEGRKAGWKVMGAPGPVCRDLTGSQHQGCGVIPQSPSQNPYLGGDTLVTGHTVTYGQTHSSPFEHSFQGTTPHSSQRQSSGFSTLAFTGRRALLWATGVRGFFYITTFTVAQRGSETWPRSQS